MPLETSRREVRRAEVRRDLIRSARAVIAARGVSGLRVSDVVLSADVGMSAFYRQFESKDELLAEVVSGIASDIADAVDREVESLDDPAEAISVWARRMVDACRSDPELVDVLIRLDDAAPRFDRIVRPLVEGLVDRGVRVKRFDLSAREPTTSMIISGVLTSVRAAMTGPLSIPEASSDAAEAVLRLLGLGLHEARAVAQRPLA